MTEDDSTEITRGRQGIHCLKFRGGTRVYLSVPGGTPIRGYPRVHVKWYPLGYPRGYPGVHRASWASWCAHPNVGAAWLCAVDVWYVLALF